MALMCAAQYDEQVFTILGFLEYFCCCTDQLTSKIRRKITYIKYKYAYKALNTVIVDSE